MQRGLRLIPFGFLLVSVFSAVAARGDQCEFLFRESDQISTVSLMYEIPTNTIVDRKERRARQRQNIEAATRRLENYLVSQGLTSVTIEAANNLPMWTLNVDRTELGLILTAARAGALPSITDVRIVDTKQIIPRR